MPFTIPSSDVAPNPSRQSVWYDTDIAILLAGLFGTGMLWEGCEVTPAGGLDLAVSEGQAQQATFSWIYNIPGNTVTLGAADPTDPRIDLLVVDQYLAAYVVAGTPAPAPKPPDLPSLAIAIAMVDVPAGATEITGDMITDKRVILSQPVMKIAAGVPTGAPNNGEQLVALDTTPGTGGIYAWDGTAWIKAVGGGGGGGGGTLADALALGNGADGIEISGGSDSLSLLGGPIDSQRAVTLAGADASGTGWSAEIDIGGAIDTAHGRLRMITDGTAGTAGQVLASDGAEYAIWTTPLVRNAAGVPAGAPGVGELPFAADTTASPATLYFWNGAAWLPLA